MACRLLALVMKSHRVAPHRARIFDRHNRKGRHVSRPFDGPSLSFVPYLTGCARESLDTSSRTLSIEPLLEAQETYFLRRREPLTK
jgi:hypothetical protein